MPLRNRVSDSRRHPVLRAHLRVNSWIIAILVVLCSLTSPCLADSDGAWSDLFAPAPRTGDSMVWDPATDRLYTFGGNGDGCYHDDLWSVQMSGNSSWVALVPLGATPGPRTAASMVLDPIRHRLIVFGGFVGAGPGLPGVPANDVWALPLDGPPVWTPVSTSGPPPQGRSGQSMIYDPVRDRVVVFGGDAGGQTALADAWALSLSGTPAWTPLPSCPASQLHPEAVFDPVRDRMVTLTDQHFGGDNDVMALSFATGTWSVLPAGPDPVMPGRDLASVVYDPDGDRMLVYGGLRSYTVLSDLWAYPLGTAAGWTSLGATSPPGPKENAPGAYDAARHQLVVAWGGADRRAWALPLASPGTWSNLTSPEPVMPSARFWHQAAYDRPRERVILYGGTGGGDEVWALSLVDPLSFTQLAPTNSPGALVRPLPALDFGRGRMLLLPRGSAGDVWALSLATAAWTHVVPAVLTPHTWNYAVGTYDPKRDRLIVFGGDDTECGPITCNSTYVRETWVLGFSGGAPTWQKLATLGEPPPELSESAAIYDPLRDRMIVYGGLDAEGPTTGRTWALTLSGSPTWSLLAEPASPALVRSMHTAIYDPVRDRMVVYGGLSSGSSQCWALDLATAIWHELASQATPPNAPYAHTAIYDPVRDRMIVSEGYNGDALNTHWALTWGEPIAGVDPVPGSSQPGLWLRPRTNPMRGPIDFAYRLPGPGTARITLLDVVGRRLDSRTVTAREGHVVLAPRVAPGLYLAEVEQGGRAAHARFVVLR